MKKIFLLLVLFFDIAINVNASEEKVDVLMDKSSEINTSTSCESSKKLKLK